MSEESRYTGTYLVVGCINDTGWTLPMGYREQVETAIRLWEEEGKGTSLHVRTLAGALVVLRASRIDNVVVSTPEMRRQVSIQQAEENAEGRGYEDSPGYNDEDGEVFS